MLYMVMHKMTPELEAGVPPDATLIQNMGALIAGSRASGIFVDGAGLKRTAERIRIRWTGGKCERRSGPLQGSTEALAGFAMLEVPSMDAAIEWATRVAEALPDLDVDVGPVVEPWDLGLMQKPPNAPLRVLITHNGGTGFEANEPRSGETQKQLDRVIAAMKDASVHLADESLKPSSRGARLSTARRTHTWTDGPFTESKELISGYSIIRVSSLAEAKAWTDRYADILGDIEVDVREVVEG